MRTRTVILTLVVLLLVALSSGCASGSTADAPKTAPTASPAASPAADEVPPLENEAAYRGLISIGLARYDLTIEDGTFATLQSMEGYGSAEWTKDDMRIVVTHRDINGEWEWTYTDEGVSVDSATPDAFTDADKTAYLALAKSMIAAVSEDSSDIAELYTWKAAGGVKQGDYTFGGPEKKLQLHIATDAEGHLGYSYMRLAL